MSSIVQRMRAIFTVDDSQVARGMAAIRAKISGGLDLATMAKGAAALGAAAAIVVHRVRAVAKEMRELAEEASRVGLGVEEFQKWKFVAEQNKVGMDVMADGFRELQMRADEFIATGSGAGAEAFEKLGFSATDLQKRLKDPSALMLEIIGRMKDLDKASRLRVADELLGGSAGENFIKVIDRGEAAVRGLMDTAVKSGRVIETDMVMKAQALDVKFTALQDRAVGFLKTLSLAAAGGVADLMGIKVTLDQIFASETEGRAFLGDEVYDALTKSAEKTAEVSDKLNEMANAWRDVETRARYASDELGMTSMMLRSGGYSEAAEKILGISTAFDQLMQDLVDKKAAPEEITAELIKLADEAIEALKASENIDTLDLSQAVTTIGALRDMMVALATKAREAADATKSAVTAETAPKPKSEWDGAPNVPAVRPPRAPSELGVPDLPSSKAGGGGGAKRDAWAEEIKAIKAETEALRQEALAYNEVATSGKRYGDAMEFARSRAALITSAMAAGKAVTPELRAEIDALAEAYVKAGLDAEDAADRLDLVAERAERGADAISDLFVSALDGADAAKKSLQNLLVEMAKVQMKQAVFGLFGGSGAASLLGSMLSPVIPSRDGGGYTWDGPRSGGLDGRGGQLALLHPEETVIDHTKPGGGGAPMHLVVSIEDDGKLGMIARQAGAEAAVTILKSANERGRRQ